MATPAIIASAPVAVSVFTSGGPTHAKGALIWKDIPGSYHHAHWEKGYQAYFFQTSVTAEIARSEFGVELPGKEYELSAKIANPERAHIREVLELTAALSKAISQNEVARLATLEADSRYDQAQGKVGISSAILSIAKHLQIGKATAYNRTHIDGYLADLKKQIAESRCGIKSPSVRVYSNLGAEHIGLLTPQERAFLLINKDSVQFEPTMKNLLRSGLTKEETELFWTASFYTHREYAKKILANAPKRESPEEKKA